jgi:hypothetical protein
MCAHPLLPWCPQLLPHLARRPLAIFWMRMADSSSSVWALAWAARACPTMDRAARTSLDNSLPSPQPSAKGTHTHNQHSRFMKQCSHICRNTNSLREKQTCSAHMPNPACTHMHAHMHTHTCTHTCTYTCTHTHTHMHTHAHTHAHTCTHMHTHARTHARPHARTHAYTTCTHMHTNHERTLPLPALVVAAAVAPAGLGLLCSAATRWCPGATPEGTG